MLGSITPLGERSRQMRWGLTVSMFALGSLVSSVLLGSVLGWGGEQVARSASEHVRVLALGGLVLVGALFDSRMFGLRVPTHRRQVNRMWMEEFRGWVYGLGYGFQLGVGVVTVVNTAATYAMLAAAVLTGSALGGALVVGSFGAVRAAAVLPTVVVRTPRDLRNLSFAIQGSAVWGERVVISTQALLGFILIVFVLVLSK